MYHDTPAAVLQQLTVNGQLSRIVIKGLLGKRRLPSRLCKPVATAGGSHVMVQTIAGTSRYDGGLEPRM